MESGGDLVEVLTVKEVAKLLNISEKTLYKWIKENRVKAVRMGALLRITKDEVDKILERGV